MVRETYIPILTGLICMPQHSQPPLCLFLINLFFNFLEGLFPSFCLLFHKNIQSPLPSPSNSQLMTLSLTLLRRQTQSVENYLIFLSPNLPSYVLSKINPFTYAFILSPLHKDFALAVILSLSYIFTFSHSTPS